MVRCRYWRVTARDLSLFPVWVWRPGLYLVSMCRHRNSTEPVGPGSWLKVLSSLLWGLTLVPGSTQLRHNGQLRERLRVTKPRMFLSSQEGLVIHVPNQLPRKRHHT